MNSSVESVVASAGFTTQAFPAASEAATVQHMSRIGKLNGMMWTDTPRGSYRAYWKLPACVVPATFPASSRAISA